MHSTFSFCSCPILIIALFIFPLKIVGCILFISMNFRLHVTIHSTGMPYFAAQRLAFHIPFEKFLSFFLSIKCLTSIQNRINCFGKKIETKKLKLLSQNVFFFSFSI